MRLLPGLCLLPLFAVACGTAPLDAEPGSTPQGVASEEREDEADRARGTAKASDEIPFVDDEPDAPAPSPSEPAVPSEPKDPIAPIASGKDACLLFGSLEQPVVGFQSARWQYQVKDCQSSACWDFFSLDIGCSLSFQHDNLLKTSKLDPALCRSAARVFISPRFIEATKACPMIVAPINESFEVEAATQVRRKFSFCETPDMQAARACLRWVAATAFGG